MIKKIAYLTLTISALLFIMSPSFALEWGVHTWYINGYKNYATHKLINKMPIKYTMSIVSKKKDKKLNDTEQLSAYLGDQDYTILLETALNTWLTDTKKAIVSKGRQKEFKDIMHYLSTPMKLEQVSKENEADLIVNFIDIYKAYNLYQTEGYYDVMKRSLTTLDFNTDFGEDLTLKEQKDIVLMVLVHEFGHFYGLTDQYFDDPMQDLEYSTNNRVKKWSIMGANYQKHLSCDDIDGFINLLDITLAIENNNQFPDAVRAENGWNSFCNGKEGFAFTKYKEGKVLNKKSKQFNFCNIKYDKEGNLAEEKCAAPFNFYRNKKILSPNTVVPSMTDKHFEYTYKYYIDKGNNKAIDVSILDKETGKTTKFNTKQIREKSKIIWNLTPEESSSLNLLKDGTCIFTDLPNRLLFALDKDNNVLERNYNVGVNKRSKQGFLFKHSILGLIKTGEDEERLNHNTCAFEYNGKEALRIGYSLITPKINLKVNEDKEMVNLIIRQHGITRDELIDGVREACADSLPETENQVISLCNYFRAVDKKLN